MRRAGHHRRCAHQDALGEGSPWSYAVGGCVIPTALTREYGHLYRPGGVSAFHSHCYTTRPVIWFFCEEPNPDSLTLGGIR